MSEADRQLESDAITRHQGTKAMSDADATSEVPAKDHLAALAASLREVGAALQWIGAVANNDKPHSGDESLGRSDGLIETAEFLDSLAATIE